MNNEPTKSPTMRRQPRQARSQKRVNDILDVAEVLFIRDGYQATTTNAIAAGAKVSIGSLYQFFPDKSAILYALAERYNRQLRETLTKLEAQSQTLSPSQYIELIIDKVYQFFVQRPGYYAIFMPLQGSVPELQQIEETADAELIKDLVEFLRKSYSGLETDVYEVIGFVLVKTIGTLLWTSFGHTEEFQAKLVTEVKRLILSYLQSHFPCAD